MHTALVQKLMRDRSAWELAFGYDEAEEPEMEADPVSKRSPRLAAAHA
jgi:UDP-3-O-[3-hydroxymyristoyl] N-acetylglucosamine deacetylase